MVNCLECDIELVDTSRHFCKACYWTHSNIHLRQINNATCKNPDCGKTNIDVFNWTRCSHTACIDCYRETPHQVIYEVTRAKNPNSRCPICAKNKK